MLGKILFAAIAVKVVDKTLDKIIKSSSTHKPASRGPISPTGVDGPIGVLGGTERLTNQENFDNYTTTHPSMDLIQLMEDYAKEPEMDIGHLTRGLAEF